jgi:hypothetical protein
MQAAEMRLSRSANLVWSLGTCALVAFLVGARWRLDQVSVFDPRDLKKVNQISKTRESASFKDRSRRGDTQVFFWPGLRPVQTSITWLEVLNGLHDSSATDGDFSWMFSKLEIIAQSSHPAEQLRITNLAPFFMVIGKDGVGATILSNLLVTRFKDYFNSWFWSGWHAMENLGSFRFAGDLFLRSARFAFAPPYVFTLGARLASGDSGQSPLSFSHAQSLLSADQREFFKRHRPDLLSESRQ